MNINKKISLSTGIVNDEYTKYVYEYFDIQDRNNTVVEVPVSIRIDDDWNIGVIYGGSGSGKTTILNELGSVYEPVFNNDVALISNFTWLTPEQCCDLLCSMGLSSVPTWLRPYSKLSNGEQYRAKLAYLVSRYDFVLIDEYTSVVDRDVAKTMSWSLQKYIRANNKKVILASCHFDIMEWLLPDWVYSPMKGRVERHDYRRQRPTVELQVHRCKYDLWDLFKHHHYLTSDLNKAADCYCATWNDKFVAFLAILPFPNGNFKGKSVYRSSRLVVLPDFQGIGIGSAFSEYVFGMYKKVGRIVYARTANPKLVKYRKLSKNFRTAHHGADHRGQTMFYDGARSFRDACSFEYIGQESNGDERMVLMKDAQHINFSVDQLKIF